MDKVSESVTGYVIRYGADNTRYSADVDADSGVLTFSTTGSTLTDHGPVTVRFIEVETLLYLLAHLDVDPGASRFDTEALREYWRTVLTEKLDAHEL